MGGFACDVLVAVNYIFTRMQCLVPSAMYIRPGKGYNQISLRPNLPLVTTNKQARDPSSNPAWGKLV